MSYLKGCVICEKSTKQDDFPTESSFALPLL